MQTRAKLGGALQQIGRICTKVSLNSQTRVSRALHARSYLFFILSQRPLFAICSCASFCRCFDEVIAVFAGSRTPNAFSFTYRLRVLLRSASCRNLDYATHARGNCIMAELRCNWQQQVYKTCVKLASVARNEKKFERLVASQEWGRETSHSKVGGVSNLIVIAVCTTPQML